MLPAAGVEPGVHDSDVLQDLVGGYAGELIERDAAFRAGLSPVLQHQIGFPIPGLGVDLRLEDFGDRGIGALVSGRPRLGLPDTEEVLIGRIVMADAIDPRRFRAVSEPDTPVEQTGQDPKQQDRYRARSQHLRPLYHGRTRTV